MESWLSVFYYYHRTKYGGKIWIREMNDEHLENYLNNILRKSIGGLRIYRQGTLVTLRGAEVQKCMNYKYYKYEYQRRYYTRILNSLL